MTGKPKTKTRLYIDAPFHNEAVLPLSPMQNDLLRLSLRCSGGEPVAVFNGHDGEWLAEVIVQTKKTYGLQLRQLIAPQASVPDGWLLFAPVKNEKIDYTVRRATELGIARLQPVMTQRSIVNRVNHDRLRANVIEAAEQSGRTEVPEVMQVRPLLHALGDWPPTRPLFFCDESGNAPALHNLLSKEPPATQWAVLIGPEGGFTRKNSRLSAPCPQPSRCISAHVFYAPKRRHWQQ